MVVTSTILLGSLAANPSLAKVPVSAIFGDHMVLQREMSVPIWGTAHPGQSITVSFGDQRHETQAAADGKWLIRLTPMPASAEPRVLTIESNSRIEFTDILVGEVWLCSGQSNMEFPLNKFKPLANEIARADWPQIRLFTVQTAASEQPTDQVQGQWTSCTPESAANFSATAYFFGRELHRELNLPVGLICSAVGGTPACAWTRRAMIEEDPDLQPIFQESAAQRTERRKRIEAKAMAAGETATAAGSKASEQLNKTIPSVLYNGMIHPLIPFAIRGVAWYQGENDAQGFINASRYEKLFPAMVKDWRKQWGQESLPFLYVQLPNYKKPSTQPVDSSWARLREAQLKTLQVPETGMAVTIDSGEQDNIHPANKPIVGHRLALAALNVAYGRSETAAHGPLFQKMEVRGGEVVLYFEHVAGQLVSKPDGEPMKGFAIAGEDGNFVWADARIDGSTVVVSNPRVPTPVAVRYAWADNPEISLFDQSGLPAAPFRTDSWPPKTASTVPTRPTGR